MTRILVTAGSTREHLDAVRYLANGSSGRMGYALAEAGRAAGHEVVLVAGPVDLEPPAVELVRVVSAQEMCNAVERYHDKVDLVFAAAAVADYRPRERSPGKPPKEAAGLVLELVPNPDILAGLGRHKAARGGRMVLVGFALEDGSDPARAEARAREKLRAKNLDLIVLNGLGAMGAADNEVTLLCADGTRESWPRQDKQLLATRLLQRSLQLLQASSQGEET